MMLKMSWSGLLSLKTKQNKDTNSDSINSDIF